jgi:hypothetical protein
MSRAPAPLSSDNADGRVYATALLKGMLTYVPGLYGLVAGGSGGTTSARYCYSVWLRHLVTAHEAGLPTEPRAVAELGPGDSLGIGLAALLTGATTYLAFDVVPYAHTARNLAILDELEALLRARAPIPGPEEFPKIKPYLSRYEFPHAILTAERLDAALAPARVAAVRRAVQELGHDTGGEIQVRYVTSWDDAVAAQAGAVDLIFSQAVMEHVDHPAETYRLLHRWLAPGGMMSHQIDFKSHGTATRWNGHWSYSDRSWKVIRGRRPYLLNRLPLSAHVRMLEAAGFEIVQCLTVTSDAGIERRSLAPRFRDLSDEDLRTSGAFVRAVKRAAPAPAPPSARRSD